MFRTILNSETKPVFFSNLRRRVFHSNTATSIIGEASQEFWFEYSRQKKKENLFRRALPIYYIDEILDQGYISILMNWVYIATLIYIHIYAFMYIYYVHIWV